MSRKLVRTDGTGANIYFYPSEIAYLLETVKADDAARRDRMNIDVRIGGILKKLESAYGGRDLIGG